MDKHEWQFALRKTVVWSEEEVKHGLHGESAATQWLKPKAQDLLEDEGEAKDLASRALEDVLPKKGAGASKLEALEDKSDDEGPSSSQKKKDDHVVEADLLSEMGKAVPKKECQVRISRMVKLMKSVKKDVGAEKGQCLEKMEKQGVKVFLEDAKGKLFDAAIQVKKAKKS